MTRRQLLLVVAASIVGVVGVVSVAQATQGQRVIHKRRTLQANLTVQAQLSPR